ncbi:helix-turn-helix transcriptional regulator [uncultured Adlercreutzia sp.]|uniref:helix-turn-helix transcriptional regulator n=1 Tax=uncultured Adlercreutzia sp. TaxID=875803 RepID=UPI0026F3F065|nr:helix-turn-helix transcriptional regulator [uncultured Adlercreutzia sp.]
MRVKPLVKSGLALGLCLSMLHVYQAGFFSAQSGDDLLARISTLVASTLLAIAILMLSKRHPHLFRYKAWCFGALGAIAIQSLLSLAQVSTPNLGMHIASCILGSLGSTWLIVLCGSSLMDLTRRTMLGAVTLGCISAYALKALSTFFSPEGGALFGVASALIVIALTCSDAIPALDKFRESSPEKVLSLTNPQSYLPFSHKLFIAIFLFACTNSFTLTAFEMIHESFPITLLGAACIVACLALTLMAISRLLSVNNLIRLAYLLAIAGLTVFLLYSASPSSLPEGIWILLLASYLLSSIGSIAFLAQMASRNPLAFVSLFTFYSVALNAGAAFDAALWSTQDVFAAISLPSGALLAAFVFVLASYFGGFFGTYNFNEAASSIQPATEIIPPSDDSSFDAACERVVKLYKLTPRESDIFYLLAHGRNGPAIQERLVLSANTVKTHVRNIYLKLEVHSHQELIDLVERT